MKTHDGLVAVLMVLVFLFVSLPYQFEFSYWAESTVLWVAYFIVAITVAVYVIYAFLQSWRRMMAEGEEEASHD